MLSFALKRAVPMVHNIVLVVQHWSKIKYISSGFVVDTGLIADILAYRIQMDKEVVESPFEIEMENDSEGILLYSALTSLPQHLFKPILQSDSQNLGYENISVLTVLK